MDINQQLGIIKRGAVEIISENELRAKLELSAKTKKPLVIKAGFDPTAPDIHLGHTVLLRKMRQFQDLGHKVVFLIGDFTGRIGDPSGMSDKRKQLNKEEVNRNAVTYQKQVAKILDMDKLKVVFNSEWLDRMSGFEFGQLMTHCTTNRLLERDDFAQRMAKKKPVYISELLYPILQGYDSVMLHSDVELGGNDQKFNLIVGRNLQSSFGQPEQVVITMPLLEGTDGIQKMSKSYGNYIGINEPPSDMFGKIMSISDAMMLKYYELLTDRDISVVQAMHPKEAKMLLAEEIVAFYHDQSAAAGARDEFDRVFGAKQLPKDMPEYKAAARENILSVLTGSGLVKSGNEARRLIKEGAVSFEGAKVTDENFTPEAGGTLKAGSRRFLKIIK